MLNRRLSLIISLLMLGFSISAQQHGRKAIDSLETKLRIAKQDTNRIKILHALGMEYQYDDYKKAISLFDEGIELSQKLNWKYGLGYCYIGRGEAMSHRADKTGILENYEKALDIALKIKDKGLEAQAYNNIGTFYSNQGNLVDAMENYLLSFKAAELSKRDNLIATGLLNLGLVNFKQNNFAKAHEYQQQALKIYKKINNYEKVASTLSAIANNYSMEGKPKEAEKYYLQSVEVYKKHGNKIGQAIVLSEMAILYVPDYEKILSYQLEAQKIFEEINPKHYNSMMNLGNIGYTYLSIARDGLASKTKSADLPKNKLQLLDLAEREIKRGLAISIQSKSKDWESYFYGTLAEVDEQRGNFKKAYDNFRRYSELNDSLYSQQMKNKIARLEAQKEVDLRDKKIELNTLKFRAYKLYFAIAAILLIALIGVFLFRSRLRGLKLKHYLENQEAERRANELQHLNKLCESELKAIRSQMNPHFIFNVLNSIEYYIMDSEPAVAAKLIQKFAGLSRLILENSTQSMVPLDKEWKALKLYVELEAMRFNDEFTYSFESNATHSNTLLVPPMLVQPLIENAIHHGLRNLKEKNGILRVKLEELEGQLVFTVEDNGVGLEASKGTRKANPFKEKSIGLESISDRLEMVNNIIENGKAVFHLVENETGGCTAVLKLPMVFVPTTE